MSYNNKIIYYCNKFYNTGEFLTEKYIGIGLVGAPICGDIIKFQILVINNIIIDVKYKICGCGSAIASSSFLSFYIKNLKLYQAIKIKNSYISQELELPIIKFHCSILLEEVLNISINNYKNNYIRFLF